MKRIVKAFTILIIAAGMLMTLSRCSTRQFDNLNQEMEYLVSGVVGEGRSIRNCVLSVRKGDGSFSWSGAAGVAHQDSQVPMTKDTPIYIASITKLYTATVIMQLYEKGTLSLDDPMSRYLPEKLIRGTVKQTVDLTSH